MLETGIVGLPNVGKSTLFNALMENAQAQAENFPFCTIEPNVGIVAVPDQQLEALGQLSESEKVVPTSISFKDIAGLVAGASKGEGLGNKFLANIRECNAIVHVVRCFEDDQVTHVDGSVDPIRDIGVINLELLLSDMAQVERRLERAKKEVRGGKSDLDEISALEKIGEALDKEIPARKVKLTEEEELKIRPLGLLTRKPIIYAGNVADVDLPNGNELFERVKAYAEEDGAQAVLISAQVEAELAALEQDEKLEFLESLGVEPGMSGLQQLIRATYSILDLQTYYTSGPKESRAWTIRKGYKAPQAAGVIHSDFERGFIRAEVIAYEDLIECGSEKEAKAKGLMRAEGKDYIVQDSDVILFRFNV